MELLKGFITSILLLIGFVSFAQIEMIEGTIVREENKAVKVATADKDQLSFYINTNTQKIPVYYNGKTNPWTFKCNTPVKLFGKMMGNIFVSNALYSECEPKFEMATKMRQNGKIYVVVAVMSTLFMGLLAYVVFTNIQLNKLKKQSEELS